VRLYSNLHQDLFNKEHKQKEERRMRGGGGLTLQELQDHNKNFWEKKKSEKGKNRAPQCLAVPPLFCPP
jgi:hypothetical protein